MITTLENIDLSVREREFLCIVGKTGCGKSTLLRLMCGFLTPDSGVIKSYGNKIIEPSPERLMVFQEGALFPWLDVIGNVEFGLKMKNVTKTKRREMAMHYLKMVEMEEAAELYVSQLSTGMKHRVAIARAFVMDPDVLFLDEPFAALDHDTTNTLMADLHAIWKKTGKTIIMVTHDPVEAAMLSTRIIKLSGRPGKITMDYKNTMRFPRNPNGRKTRAVINIIKNGN